MASMITTITAELLGAIILILFGVYIYYKYVIFNFWRKKNVFYLDPIVPVGNVLPAITGKKSIGHLFEEFYRDYKHHPFIGTYTFFKPNLVPMDPDLVRFILTKEFASFHDRGMYCNESIDPLSGHLFLLPGKKWRNLRVKLTPTFTSGKIKQMFQTLKESGDQLTKILDKKAKEAAPIEIKEIFARFSTDIIMSVAFGINANSLENPNCEFRYWGKKVFEPRAIINTITVFAPKIMDLLSIPFTEKGITKFFTHTFEDTVNYRIQHNIIRKDFMDLIIQLMTKGYVEPDDESEKNENKSNNTKITMLEGAAQAYVFFLAGFETSSTTVTHCLYELAMNPDIQEKLRKEINDVLKKHGELTYDALNEMSYLHKTINETLRKYPPVPILNRICTKDIQLPNSKVVIPEGTLVTIPILGIHKDPTIYPDPEKFDPERFNEQNVASRHAYTYLPFGEGPRICIGVRFGMVQTKIALINALSKFKFMRSPETEVPIEFDPGSLIMTPKNGVILKIERL